MTERTDDPTIQDDEAVLRRVIPSPLWILPQPDGAFRLSSAAFLDNHSGEVSVSLANETTPERLLAGYPGFSLVELRVGVVRSLGYRVVRDPTAEDPAHAWICPPPEKSKNQRKADARRMAAAVRWVLPNPPGGSEGRSG